MLINADVVLHETGTNGQSRIRDQIGKQMQAGLEEATLNAALYRYEIPSYTDGVGADCQSILLEDQQHPMFKWTYASGAVRWYLQQWKC